MVPAAFVLLDALPRTSHGKLDRRELPAPDRASSAPEEAFVAARNSTEAALADLWSSVLGVSQIGMYDNFFELGGHSLLAAQLISRVREAFQVDVPLRRVFENPTVAGLALTVIQSQADHMDSHEMEQLLSELELLAE
jgi:acyl carrier protein